MTNPTGKNSQRVSFEEVTQTYEIDRLQNLFEIFLAISLLLVGRAGSLGR
jgi:hypothetical protein